MGNKPSSSSSFFYSSTLSGWRSTERRGKECLIHRAIWAPRVCVCYAHIGRPRRKYYEEELLRRIHNVGFEPQLAEFKYWRCFCWHWYWFDVCLLVDSISNLSNSTTYVWWWIITLESRSDSSSSSFNQMKTAAQLTRKKFSTESTKCTRKEENKFLVFYYVKQ